MRGLETLYVTCIFFHSFKSPKRRTEKMKNKTKYAAFAFAFAFAVDRYLTHNSLFDPFPAYAFPSFPFHFAAR